MGNLDPQPPYPPPSPQTPSPNKGWENGAFWFSFARLHSPFRGDVGFPCFPTPRNPHDIDLVSRVEENLCHCFWYFPRGLAEFHPGGPVSPQEDNPYRT